MLMGLDHLSPRCNSNYLGCVPKIYAYRNSRLNIFSQQLFFLFADFRKKITKAAILGRISQNLNQSVVQCWWNGSIRAV